MTTHILLDPGSAEGGATAILEPNETQGEPQASWRDSLPDDLKTSPTLEKFGDPAAVAKGYVELEKAFSKRPSLPEAASSIDAYSPTVELAEGLEMDQAALTGFKEMLLAKGIPADVGSEIIGAYMTHENGRYTQTVEGQKAAMETGMAELNAKWGDATGNNTEQAVKFIQSHFSEAAREEIAKSGLGNSPALVETLYELSKNFQEDSSGQASGNQGFEFKDAKSAIDVMKADKGKMKALMDERHDDHKAVKKEWMDLHDKLVGKI